jgi:hypothetical protein
MGHADDARRLNASEVSVGVMTVAPWVFAKLGDTATAMRMIRRLEASTPRPWFTDAAGAMVMLAMGDTAAALARLDASQAASGPAWAQFIAVRDPAYDAVRGSPHFAKLVERAHLDPRLVLTPGAARVR